LAFVFNGEFNDYGFDRQILAFYLPCFVMYYAIMYFIKDKKRFNITIYFLLAIILFNCIVTQLQFYGNPIGKLIAVALTSSTDVRANIISDNDINTDLLFGQGIPIGVFGFVFSNANNTATIGLMSLIVYFNTRKRILRYGSLGLLFLCAFNCFLIQERTAFFSMAMMATYLLYKEYDKKKRIFLFVLILIGLIFVLPSFWDSDSMGRLTDFDLKEESRIDVWALAFDFIITHPLWGGPVAFEKISSVAPHNYFLNAFITCGLIGGLLAIILFFRTTIYAVRNLFNNRSITTQVLAGSYCLYSAGCLFHNASLISGDTLVILLYALFLKNISLNKQVETNENSVLHR